VGQLRLGQTVWYFDENCRVYPRDSEGKALPGGPIYSAHFRAVEITDESRDYWLTGFKDFKIRKKDLTYKHWAGGRRRIYAAPKDVEDDIYVHDNRRKIADRVANCDDIEMLKTIDRLLKEKE
jgi:hypothetical protein